MNLTGIDHFVLTVEDVESTCAFYEDLGADVVTFDEDRKAVRIGEQKINIHPVDTDIDLVADTPTVGGGDLCLITEMSISDIETQLRELDIEILAGPVERTGAVGQITSVYCRDPAGNLVEIGTYDNS
ncbi:putative lactoylglutathione lyase [Halalkaliarchaeum desulfuricum]|uniref:Putative lactoylglutathione lyase n=1 Tax=Halalkaliarchaeum desulfuricum TaxID=2055893 RepID=A0A343THB7_9EURY|nr:VOC family protein [Halalkaliarchaeum desulfuricum]AUX08489.1 putative lactoylglutathione lyase [Halalkaliarchaeum desulfuricum]